jgi:hypothetical protein
MPWSIKALRAGGASLQAPEDIVALSPLLVRDYNVKRDNFMSLAVATDVYWSTTNNGAGSAAPVLATIATTGQRVATCVTGGAPGQSVLFGTNAIHLSDNNPFIYARIQMPAAVTTVGFEIGLTNIVTTKTTATVSALTAAAVPTVGNGLTDGVVLAWNTGYTLTTPALVGVGTSTAAAGTIIQNSAGTAYTPTVSKWVDIFLQARVGQAYCEIYENDVFIGQFSVASGPDTSKLLFPFFQFRDLGASRTFNIHKYLLVEETNDR